MSLILEALKKSERQRQIGTAPTLSTPPMNRRPKRSLLPWLVIAIVVAGVAGWWLSREPTPRMPPMTDDGATPAVTQTAPAAATASKPEVPMTTVTPPPDPVAAPPPAPTSEQKLAEVNQAVKQAAPAPAVASPPATAPSVAAPSQAPSASAGKPAAGTPPPAGQAPAQSATVTPAVAAPPSASAGLPLLWELPYDKRKDMPALTMSLQVYAADPAQRFAIVNDERHVEGDSLGDGLTLKEITPEGLIVEYRSERFLFPRGGR